MLRRLILTLSLVASFGLAQIAAVSHELSHYVEANAEHTQQNHSKITARIPAQAISLVITTVVRNV